MENLNPNLFTRKELYEMEHSISGSSRIVENIPKRNRRKMVYDNMHLLDGIGFSKNQLFPQLKPYNGPTDFVCVPFTERKKYDGHNQAIHFFLHDYKFRDAVWCNLEHTSYSLVKYDYVFSPDLSLWKDLPTEFYNIRNIYYSRFIVAYWQHCGFNVIPTASWGNLDSFSYCFQGLPQNSVIAVSGMGNQASSDSYNRWCYGIRRLEESLCPTMIIVYGQDINVPDIHTPLKFIPDFISTKLRKL